ncbi:unnamed protein product [Scytosiphon promiscuus]
MFAVPRVADDMLLMEVQNESEKGVLRCLAAGASINGSPQSGEEFPPIVMAAAVGSARMIKLLHEKGADIDAGTWREASFAQYSRAVHVCACSEEHRVLGALRQVIAAGADLNATNAQGCTALMLACGVDEAEHALALAKLLLEAGARTDAVDKGGRCALHYAAYSGNADLIKMLLSKGSLSTLNHISEHRNTPLLVAADSDHAEAVSVLLSAGASQREVLRGDTPCPFRLAVLHGKENALRVLASERGLKAVGGGAVAIPDALGYATRKGVSIILKLVLQAEGEERQQYWASRRSLMDMPLIFVAAAFGILSSVKVLLAAGAHELERDPRGRIALNNIGILHEVGEPDPREVAAIRRALQRGPAYRARSWAWPAAADEKAIDRAPSASARAKADIGRPSVDIVRPGDRQLLWRQIARYSLKP